MHNVHNDRIVEASINVMYCFMMMLVSELCNGQQASLPKDPVMQLAHSSSTSAPLKSQKEQQTGAEGTHVEAAAVVEVVSLTTSCKKSEEERVEVVTEALRSETRDKSTVALTIV